MKQYILLFALVSIFAINSYCQSNEAKAKYLYEKAQSTYEIQYNHLDRSLHDQDADYEKTSLRCDGFQKVQEAEDTIMKVISMVGRNPKTLYLLIKIRYLAEQEKKWLASKEGYNTILTDINEFASKIDKKTYPQDKYDEIMQIKKETEAQLELPQIKNQLTFTSKEQAVQYILTTLNNTRNYNYKSDVSARYDHTLTSISAKWDGQNIITVFAYIQNPVSVGDKYCEYYAAVLDLTELQRKDTVEYPVLDEVALSNNKVVYLRGSATSCDGFQYKYRSHGYQFPKNAHVSKIIAASDIGNFKYPKYNKQIQSLQDIDAKIDKKYITTCNYAFDIFLNLYLGVDATRNFDFAFSNGRYLNYKMNYDDYSTPKKINDTYFRENMEVNYLKAWDYLYALYKK